MSTVVHSFEFEGLPVQCHESDGKRHWQCHCEEFQRTASWRENREGYCSHIAAVIAQCAQDGRVNVADDEGPLVAFLQTRGHQCFIEVGLALAPFKERYLSTEWLPAVADHLVHRMRDARKEGISEEALLSMLDQMRNAVLAEEEENCPEDEIEEGDDADD